VRRSPNDQADPAQDARDGHELGRTSRQADLEDDEEQCEHDLPGIPVAHGR
jgi:hypothetical protein